MLFPAYNKPRLEQTKFAGPIEFIITEFHCNLKTFDQLPKKNLRILALDRKFKITQNDINKTFDQLKSLK